MFHNKRTATYSHKKVVNLYVVYEITNFHGIDNYPTLTNALFGTVKLTENADIDKYRYFGYGIGFDEKGFYSHLSGGTGGNVIIFGADMSSYSHIDNKKKDILILGKGQTQGLDKHSLSAEKMCLISLANVNRKFCLSLHDNGANSYQFVNGTEIHKFTAKNSEIVANNLYLGNVSKNFSASNMKKTGCNGYIYDFSGDYDAIEVSDILDIHKYFMEKKLLLSANSLECVSINNQECKVRP